MLLLQCAEDEFEAALALYLCECHAGICSCTRIASAHLPAATLCSNPDSMRWAARCAAGRNAGHADGVCCAVASTTTLAVRPLLEHRGEVQPFDEYKCPEKIDFTRLKRVVAELRPSKAQRLAHLDALRLAPSSDETRRRIKLLERLQGLEMTAVALLDLLTPLPVDGTGCVVHEVMYEHKDPAWRGRLFAVGEQVQAETVRTVTLQGMPRDLRPPLAGAFAHDIDCENSEVRFYHCSPHVRHSTSTVPTRHKAPLATILQVDGSTHSPLMSTGPNSVQPRTAAWASESCAKLVQLPRQPRGTSP